jgi:hypothetical protein
VLSDANMTSAPTSAGIDILVFVNASALCPYYQSAL